MTDSRAYQARGDALYAARDYPNALEAYRAALALNRRPARSRLPRLWGELASAAGRAMGGTAALAAPPTKLQPTANSQTNARRIGKPLSPGVLSSGFPKQR
jgi:tetratricopeptide (TPR) repeat protein